jgi:D-alanyl-D-alanine carboxypeptidase
VSFAHPTIAHLTVAQRQRDLRADAARGRRTANSKGQGMQPSPSNGGVAAPRSADRASSKAVIEKPVRRLALLVVALGLVFSGVVGSGGTAEARSCDPCPVITTSDLNLRAGPGTNHKVLTVIPAGVELLVGNETNNGYGPTGYAGNKGWAHRDYMRPADALPAPGTVIGTAVTTDDLNLRTGPGTGHSVIYVVRANTRVEVTDATANGYRYVYHAGVGGWMADQYLSYGVPNDPQQPGYAVTTADLNLRAGPSTADKVLLVMASGSTVRLGDQWANGYRMVTYAGTTGWAATAYLN